MAALQFTCEIEEGERLSSAGWHQTLCWGHRGWSTSPSIHLRSPEMVFQCNSRDAAPVPHITCSIFCSACAAWADDRRLLLQDL